jgi:CHAD domain-containing protein
VTVLATYPTGDPLFVEFDPSLQLGRAEPLAVGLRRVTLEQFEHAAKGFFEGEEVFLHSVHEARKAGKRIRALLRLVSSELKAKVFSYEDRTLRDTGRMLAPTRAADSMVDAAEVVADLYGEFLAKGTFDELVQRLKRRRELIRLQTMEDPKLVVRVVRNMEKAHQRYASWPVDPDARSVYGMGIRDDFRAISPGLTETYTRGRREMVAAYGQPTDHNFHEWRKRVKYLRHQMEFLAPLWPEMIVGMAVTLDRLGFLLGEDHDLGELVVLLHDRPDLCPNPRERSLFYALVVQRRSELRLAAEILGRRIYAEKPGSVDRRFEEYWGSRRLVIDKPLDTLTIL